MRVIFERSLNNWWSHCSLFVEYVNKTNIGRIVIHVILIYR